VRLRVVLVLVLVALAIAGAWAQTVTVGANAVNNATVQPGGPRGGLFGKVFFNIEGNQFGSFASFGVVDFSAADFGLSAAVADVQGITLKLYDAPASFSANGTVRVWLSEATAVDIEPTTSPLRWNASALPDGVGNQLQPLHLLGSGTYTKTTLDTEFVYTLTVPASARQYLVERLNSRGRIRLVVTPAEDGVAATYAGHNHYRERTPPARPPRLELTVLALTRFNILGNVQLLDFGGDITQVPIIVTLRSVEAGVIERRVYLDANGNYTIPDVEPGIYDIAFKASHWLQVVVREVNVVNADVTGVNVALLNGDVDGDNEITLFDFGELVAAFGSLPEDTNWNPEADLDGDGEVTLFDFGILVQNFGAIGDE